MIYVDVISCTWKPFYVHVACTLVTVRAIYRALVTHTNFICVLDWFTSSFWKNKFSYIMYAVHSLLWKNKIYSNRAELLTIVHKSNNICQKICFCHEKLFIKFQHFSYNADRPQEASFETTQFNYFQHHFHLRNILFLSLLLVWSLANYFIYFNYRFSIWTTLQRSMSCQQ